MRSLRREFVVVTIITSLAQLACGRGPTPDEVRERTSSILGPMMIKVAGAADGAVQTDGVRTAAEQLARLLGQGRYRVKPDSLRGGAARAARDLDELLGRYVFNAQSLESSSGDTSTFLLQPSLVCGSSQDPFGGSYTVTNPTTGETYSTKVSSGGDDCLAAVQKLALHIDATLVDDGVDLGLRVGNADTVVVFELRPDRITARVMLGAMLDTAVAIEAAIGQAIDGLPTSAKGVLSATIYLLADGAGAKLAVEQAIDVQGQGGLRLSLPQANPLAAVEYTGGKLSFDVDVGLVKVALPGSLFGADDLIKPFDKVFELVLQGLRLEGGATVDGKLKIDSLQLGQGTSSLAFGQDKLVKVELNPDQGWSLGGEIAPYNGLLRCMVAPSLDLRVQLGFGALGSYLVDSPPAWAANETFQALMTAAAGKSPTFDLLDGDDGVGGTALLRMVEGQLLLRSVMQPVTVTVGPGQCLRAQSGPASVAPLSKLSAGTCP